MPQLNNIYIVSVYWLRDLNEQECPGGCCPTLTQIIKGQMQLTIGWLQLGRTYFILDFSGSVYVHSTNSYTALLRRYIFQKLLLA